MLTIDIEPVKVSEVLTSIDIHIPYVLSTAPAMPPPTSTLTNAPSMFATVAFKNADGIIRKTCRVPLTPAEVQNWTVSDDYVINILLQRLGLEKKYFNPYAGTPLESSDAAEDWSCPFQWLFETHDEMELDRLVEINFFQR